MKIKTLLLSASVLVLASVSAQAEFTRTDKWSGYALFGSNTGQKYHSISGTWRIPPVKWGNTNRDPYGYQYNTIWVGIGGINDRTLLQLGTETTVTKSGTQRQYMWYELYPAMAALIPHPAAPGDVITASIDCVSNCTPGVAQNWKLSLRNHTKNWTWTKSVTYTNSMNAAEWILEAPYYNGVLPLNNYGKHTFYDLKVNGQVPALSHESHSVSMANPAGQTSQASQPSGGSFSTCYGWLSFTPC